jgi:hypothetical protein
MQRGMAIGDRTTTRHLSHPGSPVQLAGTPSMCTGQRNFVTALVRLNAKIRGRKAHSVTVCRHTAAMRQFRHWPCRTFSRTRSLAGSFASARGPPGFSGSYRSSTEQQQLTWPPLPDQVKRGGRCTSACSNKFVDYPQAATLPMPCRSVVSAVPNLQGASRRNRLG